MSKKIPKIASFYWGNSTMSFVRFMTLQSFATLNPDWQLCLYVPTIKDSRVTHDSFENKREFKVTDYTKYLANIKNLSVIEIDFATMGIPVDMSDVYKSDILRWKILAEDGGIWSDMDIIFHLPMTMLSYKEQFNTNHVIVRYNDKSTNIPIGFLMSAGDSNVYYQCFRQCMELVHNSDSATYQKFGTEIFSNIVRANGRCSELYKESVYPFSPGKHIHTIYLDTMKDDWRTKHNIGIHWFGGHPGSHNAERFASPTNLDAFGTITHALRAYENNTTSIREQFNV